ncbi:MAG: hypothetical protein AB7E34_05980 [Acidaminococcaceae bacterium]
MVCKKCGFEYEDNLRECPNCQTPNEPEETKVLNADERDTFKGITIDEAGETENKSYSSSEDKTENIFKGTHVYHTSVSTGHFGFIWQLLFLIVVAGIVFVLLPAFLLVFMAMAAFYLLLRLFR